MSTVIQFPNKRPTVCRTELEGDLNCITVNGYGEQLFITDWQLGFALGYAAPLAGIEWVLKHYRIESKWCSFLVDLGEPEADGRTRVLVFDLDAAMHICKCARTPSSHFVYARIGFRAINDFALSAGTGAGPEGKVLSFPKPKKKLAKRALKRGIINVEQVGGRYD